MGLSLGLQLIAEARALFNGAPGKQPAHSSGNA
jgi:hypothetical protein